MDVQERNPLEEGVSTTGGNPSSEGIPAPDSGAAGAAAEASDGVTPETGRFSIGQRVWGSILRLTENHAVVSLSEHGTDEGTLDLIHLRDEFGNLSVAEGDEVQAYVVKVAPSVQLAPSLSPPAAVVMQKLQKALEDGEAVRGRVTGVNRGGLDVDIEGRRAFCPYSQIEIGRCENPDIYLNHILEFKVSELDPEKKRIILSHRAILVKERTEKMGELRAQIKEGAEFDGVVKRLQPFGAFVDIGGVEGLVHISEISYDRLEHPRYALRTGEKVRVRVLGLSQGNDGRERIKLSIKATLEDPWTKVPEQFHEGDIVKGTVVRITDFGAFVKLYPGIEALLHVSQYKPRGRQGEPESTAAPAEAGTPAPTAEAASAPAAPDGDTAAEPDCTPKLGQEIFVRVNRIDLPRRRISLALRDEDRPDGGKADHDAVIGEVVEGVVRAVKPYGVFLDLPSVGPWVSGLLPGVETGLGREVNLARKFPTGDRVQVEIIDVDDRGRIRLSQRSIREREEKQTDAKATKGSGDSLPTAPPGGFNVLAEAFKRAEDRQKGKDE